MNQKIDVSSLGRDVSLAIKREDLLHPIISGNKFRKLKYTIAH
ncbi:MAG: 1-aminocyclopropane-1-carboxylate deaminase/D-cysteine desulfhydrase, partial [Patiriisocius sp.]